MARKKPNPPALQSAIIARLVTRWAAARASARAFLPRRVVRRLERFERRLEARRARWLQAAARAREGWQTGAQSLQNRMGSAAASFAREVAARLGLPSRTEVERLRKRISELEVRMARSGATGDVRRGSAA